MDLTEEQWDFVEPLIPKPRRRPDGRGRPWRDPRDILEAVLWMLRTGAPWKDLPARYPPYQTCHRRYQQWCRDGTIERVLHALAEHLYKRGGIDITEAFIHGHLRRGQKGGFAVGKTKRGKGTKIMAIADRHGLPIAAGIASASPHETKLLEATVDACFLRFAPACLVGDRAYDSDPLDQRLRQERGIELIAPHRSNRKRAKTQDGRVLRRYRWRWKIERLFACLLNYRRITNRWDRHAENFLGFVRLGCLRILLRHL
ncbi:MAG TPA: IS5 family transposase [Anaeromyxobacteraceae bacterium]|nr:IS5 family transposase [Anaeromyxobacteraceae bacterium]